jgi:hypothetical protein
MTKKVKPLGMSLIDMVDIEYLIEDKAYSMSLPVYYKKETKDYLILFDIDRGTTLSVTGKDMDLLEESLKDTILDYYENEK